MMEGRGGETSPIPTVRRPGSNRKEEKKNEKKGGGARGTKIRDRSGGRVFGMDVEGKVVKRER